MRKVQLILYEQLRERYKNNLSCFAKAYIERIEPAFADIEDEAKKIEDDYLAEMSSELGPEDLDMYYDIAEEAKFTALEHYQKLSLIKYQSLLGWISLLSQMWEQQITGFLSNELRKEGFTRVQINYWDVEPVFQQFGVELKDFDCWDTIKEMRKVVNVIKHAEGPSADYTRQHRPDLLEFDSSIPDKLELYKTSLNEETLNISNEDLINYYEALIDFWDRLPERMEAI